VTALPRASVRAARRRRDTSWTRSSPPATPNSPPPKPGRPTTPASRHPYHHCGHRARPGTPTASNLSAALEAP